MCKRGDGLSLDLTVAFLMAEKSIQKKQQVVQQLMPFLDGRGVAGLHNLFNDSSWQMKSKACKWNRMKMKFVTIFLLYRNCYFSEELRFG